MTLRGFPNQMDVDSVRDDTLRTGERAMGQPIEITRTDLTAAELRAAAVVLLSRASFTRLENFF